MLGIAPYCTITMQLFIKRYIYQIRRQQTPDELLVISKAESHALFDFSMEHLSIICGKYLNMFLNYVA